MSHEPDVFEVGVVTPQVFSSIIALHLHEHKHASFHVIFMWLFL
jgi:hypothetical protein